MKKSSFIGAFFKKMYFIPALFFTALIAVAFLGAFEFGFISTIFANKKYFIATIIGSGAVLLLVSYLLIFNLSNKNVNLNDTIPFCALFFGGVMLAFVLIKYNNLSTKMILSFALPFVYALLFISIRAITFNRIADTNEEKKCKISAYLSKVFEKYPPIAVFFTAVLISCFWFLLLARNFSLGFTAQKNILLFICAIPVLFYLLTKTGCKKISLFDAFVVALDMSLVILVAIIITYKNEIVALRNYVVLAIVATLAIFYTAVRLISFKPCGCCCNKQIEAKTKFGYYVKTMNKKYNFSLAVAVGSLIAMILLVFFRYTLIYTYYNKGNVKLALAPFTLLSASLYFVLILGAIVSFVNIKAKDVTAGDFLNVMCLAFCLFGLPTAYVYNSPFVQAGLFVAILTLGATLSIRIKTVYCANK